MTKDEALRLALEALEMWCPMTATYLNTRDKAIGAIKQALEQPEPEPVFWYRPVGEDGGYEGPIHNSGIERVRKMAGVWKPLYTSPPKREPEPEPVAYAAIVDGVIVQTAAMEIPEEWRTKGWIVRPLVYGDISPPKREWQGLTDEEVFDIWLNEMPAPDKVFYQKLCRSVEAKLKQKNGFAEEKNA